MEAPYSLQLLQQQLYHEFQVLKKINRAVSENLEINPIFQFDKIYSETNHQHPEISSKNACTNDNNDDANVQHNDTELDEFTNLNVTMNTTRRQAQSEHGFSYVEGMDSEDDEDEDDDLEYPESVDEENENDAQLSSMIQGNLSDLKHDLENCDLSRTNIKTNYDDNNRQNINELMKISIDFLGSDLSSNLNLKDIAHKLNLEFMKLDSNNEEDLSEFDEFENFHLLQEMGASSENDEPKLVEVDKLHGVKIRELSDSVNVKSRYYINELENYWMKEP